MNPSQSSAAALSREQFALVRDLFHRVFDLSADDRTALLDKECAGRADVRTALEHLIQAAGSGPEHLNPESGAIARQVLRQSDTIPEQIGPYRIGRLLGRGGMGEVYLAQQENPQREVALKVVLHASASLRVRFAREIRALGRLEHPNIARIYDAGTAETPQGPVSYLAMEYIPGARLTDFAQRHGLSTAERVDLVAKIADAVQHAHTKGVIHRDIKPSNILVSLHEDSTGSTIGSRASAPAWSGCQPKILDFGVARVLEPAIGPADATEQGALLGTTAYMSPEQFAGDNEAVDARTDIYTLGVLLYELLSGRLPYDVRCRPIADAARMVREDEPAPLNASANSIKGRYDRDLETIIRHALEKDRERRYPTAAAFADDLRRYLRLEPILARPATLTYQLSKFARRHRSLVAGVVTAFLALAAGLGVSTAMYWRAQAQTARADAKERQGAAMQNYIIEDVLKAAAPDRLGSDASLLQVILNARNSLHERFADQPEVEAQIHVTLAGVLQSLGKLAESLEEWDAAIALLQQSQGQHAEQTISAMINRWAVLTQLRRFAVASQDADKTLALAQRSLPADHDLVIRATDHVAASLAARASYAKAAAINSGAIDLVRRSAHPDASFLTHLLSAQLYYERERRNSDPVIVQKLALEIQDRIKALPPDDPACAQAIEKLMVHYKKSGRVKDAASLADSLAEMLEHSRTSPITHGLVLTRMSGAFQSAGDLEKAEKYGLESFNAYASLYKDFNSSNEAAARRMIGIYASWPGHTDQLRQWCARAIAIRMMLSAAPDPSVVAADVRKQSDLLTTHAAPLTPAQLLQDVWSLRDDLAPPNHPRRAAFYANFAMAAKSLQAPDHVDESLALAKSSLDTAANPTLATELLNAAAPKPE